VYEWTIDTVAPETTIDSGPADPTRSTSASFAFSAEDGATFECKLDAGDWAACTSPKTYTALTDGAHSFQVRATDRAGNSEAAPASVTWAVDTVAPETTIDAGPPDPSSESSAEFEFSSEVGSTFECQLDTGAWDSCSSPQTYSDLAAGAHTFRVRATDRAGNVDPEPSIFAWTVEAPGPSDTTAPETTITAGPAALTSSTSASFSFSSSETGSTFECSLDNATFAACTSPRDYTGLGAGAHNFRVRAIDPAGNVDETPASQSWTVDTAAPETTITAAPAAQTSSTTASFGFSSSETGSTFECSLDNAAFAACTSPHSYTGLAIGAHSFRVRAIDAVGNVDGSPASHSWTVDTAAPETTITAAPAALTSSTSASFGFSSSETGSTFECSLDNATFAACTSPRDYTGLGAGAHSFRVRAIDAAGNADATPALHNWTVDTTAPQTSITSAPPAQTSSTSASFGFSSSETGSTFECSLDNAAFAACTSPRDYTGLAAGAHTFRVRAIDAAGNVDGTPASHTWTISLAPVCAPSATAAAAADAWIDENSASTNKGTDSILKVQSKANDNFRALVRFNLPTLPQGCVIESATLRLYAASTKPGRTLHAVRVAAPWSENVVTWANQPPTTGSAATTESGSGYREWNVTPHVQAMVTEGANHGFLIRDAAEGADAEQQFHSREKGENTPQLVLRFSSTGG
jgi:hypothetical protein